MTGTPRARERMAAVTPRHHRRIAARLIGVVISGVGPGCTTPLFSTTDHDPE